MVALTGSEITQIVGVDNLGRPSGTAEIVTVAQIAATVTTQPLNYASQQNFVTNTLTDASIISWDVKTAQTARLTLTGSHTLGLPTNLVDGGTYILFCNQTGNKTLAYASGYKWPAGSAPSVSSATNAKDIFSFISDGTNMYGSLQKAFS